MTWVKLKGDWHECDRCGARAKIAPHMRDKPVYHQCVSGSLDCPHRSPEPTGEVACELCGGQTRMVPIYACVLHGECALSRTKSGTKGEYRQCLTCEDRPE